MRKVSIRVTAVLNESQVKIWDGQIQDQMIKAIHDVLKDQKAEAIRISTVGLHDVPLVVNVQSDSYRQMKRLERQNARLKRDAA